MKKITLGFLLASSLFGFSQVTLIDPNGDGGFETGATFAANGWTEIGPPSNTNRRWYCGTGQTGFTGTRAAFIGDNETTVSTANGAKKVHLYKTISIPAGATNIVLNFKYKQEVADFISPNNYYDYITVSTGTDIPATGAIFTSGTTHFGPFPSANITSFTNQTVTLPNTLAGTTTNLVFSFICDNITPKGYGAIDDVSLVYTAALSTIDVVKNSINVYPNPVKNVLNLSHSESIQSVEIFNTLGQSVLTAEINNSKAAINISQLAIGNYIVKAKTPNGIENIKIIKE